MYVEIYIKNTNDETLIMKPTSYESIENTQVANLFKNTLVITLAHVLAAVFLVFSSTGKIDDKFISHWFALLAISILVSLLGLSFFRRQEPELEALKKWESVFANTSICTGLVFAIGYCYVIYSNPSSMITLSCLIVVMHVSSIVVPCFGSRRGALSLALPILIPVIAMLVFLQSTESYIFASALSLYSLLFLFIGLSFHIALKQNMILKDKYKSEVKLNQRYKTKIDTLTIEDSLTRIYNRKFFDLMIGHEARRAKRFKTPLSIAILEIDSFDEYKHNYGNENSEKLLIVIAKQLSNSMARGGEFVARYATNQFVLLLPNSSSETAIQFVKKIIGAISELAIEHEYTTVDELETVTLSAGIAEVDHTRIIDTSEINKHAQYALLEAKSFGGNKYAEYSDQIKHREREAHPQESKIISLATNKGKNIAL